MLQAYCPIATTDTLCDILKASGGDQTRQGALRGCPGIALHRGLGHRVYCMAISSAQDFAKDIEKAVSLGEKATEDPDAAQQVTGLIKVLQSYKASTS